MNEAQVIELELILAKYIHTRAETVNSKTFLVNDVKKARNEIINLLKKDKENILKLLELPKENPYGLKVKRFKNELWLSTTDVSILFKEVYNKIDKYYDSKTN